MRRLGGVFGALFLGVFCLAAEKDSANLAGLGAANPSPVNLDSGAANLANPANLVANPSGANPKAANLAPANLANPTNPAANPAQNPPQDSPQISPDSPPNRFVFNADSLLNQKSADFVGKVSSELFAKTGVNLVVFMAQKLPENKDYAVFRADFATHLVPPFGAIVLFYDDKKLDIFASSDEVLSKKERKKIYWEYMTPLLPQKAPSEAVLSAVVLNGYIEAVDIIAAKHNATIESNVKADHSGARAVSKLILYAMLFSLLGIFAFAYIFKKRFAKSPAAR